MRMSSPFPDYVRFCCLDRSDLPSCDLMPEEATILSAAAVEIRRAHFSLGRNAARRALAELTGKPAGPVLSGKQREPLWPEGVVGSITHTGDIALAAVALQRDTAGLGLDAELHTRTVSYDIARHVCRPSELPWVEATSEQRDFRLKQIFSAKESIFKALYPQERVYLDFLDAEISWDAERSVFIGRLHKAAGKNFPIGYSLTIGCQTIGDYIVTHTLLPPASR